MKRLTLSMALLVLFSVLLSACGTDTPTATPIPTSTTAPPPTPTVAAGGSSAAAQPTPATNGDAHITVQHILIGFKDAVGFQGQAPPKAAARTQEQAKALAYDLLKRAKAGEDFDKLVADNTDDQAPGIYSMANNGVTPGVGEAVRGQMVPAFGNVGFSLKVGEIGIADYDPQTSPFGYHIIKRLETKPVMSTEGQDQHITVQHILIGFKDAVGFQGQVPPKAATRTQAEAKTLAYQILDMAKSGQNFDDLVKQYTDDQAPGIYSLANIGATPTAADEYPRNQMVPAFGNVGFSLKVGEIGIADYDPQNSPFGYHIIKRIR